MLFGQLGMLFVFMCVCVSCVFILFLIVDIRNPLEEMVLKIYSTLIFAKSFDLWWVFNRSDVLFRFFIWSSAFFCFHVTLFFSFWSHAFFFFHRCIIGNTFFFLLGFSCSCYIIHPSVINEMVFRSSFFSEFGGLNSNSSLTVFLT